MAYTEINNFSGGQAESKYKGQPGSFSPESYGLDIHSEPGILQAAWKLTKNSGSTVTDLVLHHIASSDGSSYFFGDSGDIYKRTSGGTWSAPRDETVRICGAIEYNGYFLWATSNKLFRMAIAGNWSDGACEVYNAGGSAWSGTLTNTTWSGDEVDTSWHRMARLGVDLYIGAGQYVTQVDSSFVVNTQGLDLPPDWIVVDMVAANDRLYIGAYNTTKDTCSVFVWDGYSDSWESEIPIPEDQIYALTTDGNFVYVKAGDQGNIYQIQQGLAFLIKNIYGTYTSSATEKVNPGALTVKNGRILMGYSKNGGDPANEGVYTFPAGSVSNYKPISLEFPISSGNLSSVEIGCIGIDGGVTFVSWKDTTSGTVYGVDIIDYTARFDNAIYVSSIIGTNRAQVFNRSWLNHEKLPASCSIDLKYRKNNDSSWTSIGSQVTTTNKTNSTFSTPINFNTIEFQAVLGTSGTSTPKINSMLFQYGANPIK